MNKTSMVLGFAMGIAVGASCDGTAVGTCVSSGGIVDSCKPDFTKGECEEWDDEMVNGGDWTFSKKSCPTRGFPVKCEYDATHVRTQSDC
jgi:hypothetical protein